MGRETNTRQAEAFTLYWTMGEDRGYRKVAKAMGVSDTTVSNWARKYDWQNRILEMDRKASSALEKKAIKTVVDQKANFSKLIHNMIVKAANQIVEGKGPKIETVVDLERMVKLWLLLNNANTDKVSVEVEGEISAPIPTSQYKELIEGNADAKELIKQLFRLQHGGAGAGKSNEGTSK